MAANLLPLAFLGSTALSLSTVIGPWFLTWPGHNARTDSVVQTVLGDARRLFGGHFYAKADAYFHNGYYPSIFDTTDPHQGAHLAAGLRGTPADDHAGHEEEDFLGRPRDWIEAFGRHFFQSRHSHLGGGHAHDHDHDCKLCADQPDHDHAGHGGHGAGRRVADEREMLPWLKLSVALDPHRIETYVVTAYWLRTGLQKVNEAEQFLREGLRQNPGNAEILFEIGRIQAEDRKDTVRARNIWELALKNWLQLEEARKQDSIFLGAQVLGQLARLEEAAGNHGRAIEHLTVLRTLSPNPQSIQKWIDEIQAKAAPAVPAVR
ncbi:MAG: hypothetical protein RJA22_2536 [Verrucomicrobiota bacterium]|jgi:tetratricopeptide (TPR) repeat protein